MVGVFQLCTVLSSNLIMQTSISWREVRAELLPDRALKSCF